MAYKRLYILAEGPDDQRFFESVVKPCFEEKYDWTNIIIYSGWKPKKIENFIHSIKSMRADYLYLADINESPCTTKRKEEINEKLGAALTDDRISIVIKEIEGWYLSGLTDHKGKSLKVRFSGNTNNVTKEKFDSLIPKGFDSRIDFMVEILKYFSIPTARRKNKSFAYFWKKHIGCTPHQR